MADRYYRTDFPVSLTYSPLWYGTLEHAPQKGLNILLYDDNKGICLFSLPSDDHPGREQGGTKLQEITEEEVQKIIGAYSETEKQPYDANVLSVLTHEDKYTGVWCGDKLAQKFSPSPENEPKLESLTMTQAMVKGDLKNQRTIRSNVNLNLPEYDPPRYLIASAGNKDFTNTASWSSTADGLTTPASAPTNADAILPSAIIDNGATLTIDTAVQNCLSIDMSSVAAYAVTLAGSQNFYVNGTINLTGMVISFTGQIRCQPHNGVTANVTIPQELTSLLGIGYDTATTGIINLLTNIKTSLGIVLKYGTINTNGNTITCTSVTESSAQTRAYNLGASVFNCTSWTMTATNNTFDAGTSTIKVSGTGVFAGGNLTYYNVELNGTQHTISGTIVGTAISFKPTGSQVITWTDGSTNAFTNAYNTGGLITWKGTGAAGYTVNITGAYILENISVSRCTATTPLVLTGHPVNGGNNVGITFRRRTVE
jgi:hypothetical protein